MILAALALGALLAQTPPQPPAATPTPTPERLLGMIRARFRSHRPPPPFVTYTFVRTQKTDQGYPDVVNSCTYRVWCRTVDRAALGRRVFRDDYEYPPEFLRPAFNQDRDPGPPTADLFEPAPSRPRPVSEVPTPEPTRGPEEVIGRVQVFVESDYTATSVVAQGDELLVHLEPKRDPDRNRLRELDVDAATLELRRVVATDKLFINGTNQVYPATFTIVLGTLEGIPVVTSIHGRVGGGYQGDGAEVDMQFREIRFPKSLPDWYFNPRTYGQHTNGLPH